MKKFLSLVLALVMTMSLVTISAGAKDFTDDSKITYEEAVDVMSALKVIDGYADGSFNPQGSLTRGAAAKIICNLILGPTTAAALSADTAPYKDVPVNHTFAGYIAYCQQQGIISGYADGTFRPAATLTNYAFLKMLLGALGYDSEIEGYIGDNWSIQVAKQALAIGLTKGMKTDLNGTDYATREQACLYALNTLKATMVDYDAKITATVNGAQVTVGNSVATDVKWNIASKADGNIKDDNYVQFAEKYFPNVELEITNGIYGRPANTWKNKKAEIGTYTSIDPTYIYTESTDSGDVYKDLGKAIVEEYDWESYINGKEVKVVLPVKSSDDEYVYTGEGTVTEIYVNEDDETVTLVEINNYLGQVSKVKSDDDGEYITVKELSKGQTLDVKTFYVEGYDEDDYVVFTVDYDEDEKDYVIGEVFEPETVTAEVTRVDKDDNTGATYLRASGTKYTYAEDETNPAQQKHIVYDLDGTLNDKVHPTLNEEYILYLDPNGYVLGFKLADEEETKYLYVLDSDEEMGDWQVKALFADGTQAKIDVKDEVKNFGTDTDGVYVYDADSKADITWVDGDGKELKDGNQDIKVKSNIDNKIFSYSVSSKGVYTLTCVKQGAAAAEKQANGTWNPDVKINSGRAYVTIGENDYIVDSKTVFTDKEGETAYTGYKNVPNVEHADVAYAYNAKNGKILDIIFILDGIIYDKDSTYFVLTKDTRESLKYDDDLYWDYSKAYVNGEPTKSLIVAYDALVGGTSGKALTPGVLYKATKTIDEQYITEVEVVGSNYDGTIYGEVETVGVDAFWLKKGNTYTEDKEVKFDTNDETVFVLVEKHIDEDGKITWTVSDGNINDLKKPDDAVSLFAQVVEKDDETAELVYIFLTTKEGAKTPAGDDTYVVNAWQDSNSGNVCFAFYKEDGTALTTREVRDLGLSAKNFTIEINDEEFDGLTIEEYGENNNGCGFVKVNFGEVGTVLYKGDKFITGGTDNTIDFDFSIAGLSVNYAASTVNIEIKVAK